MYKFESQKKTSREKKELSWKSVGEAEMQWGGYMMLIVFCWWKVQSYMNPILDVYVVPTHRHLVVKFNNSIFSSYYMHQGVSVLFGVVYELVFYNLLLLVNVKMVLYYKSHKGDFWELFMLLHKSFNWFHYAERFQLDLRKWFGRFLLRPWGVFTTNAIIYAIWLL